MDGLLGIYLVLIFIALIALGVPIAISIGVSSIAVLTMSMPFEVSVSTAGQKMVNGIDSFSLLAVPLFVLAGNIMNHGGIALRLVRFAYVFVGRIPGAVTHVNIVANMLFGAVSGSAVAAVAAVGKTLLPEAKANGMDISYAQPFLETVFSEMSGHISGKIRAEGPVDELNIYSEGARIDE